MRRRPIHFATADQAAIGEVNTTPLIDVMLVLLILCIISIPMMTHKVPIRLPPVGDSTAEPQVYRLALNASGGLTWNGVPTSPAELPRRLEVVARNPDSVLEISASGAARYEDYDKMLAVVAGARIERIGFAGNAPFAKELDN